MNTEQRNKCFCKGFCNINHLRSLWLCETSKSFLLRMSSISSAEENSKMNKGADCKTLMRNKDDMEKHIRSKHSKSSRKPLKSILKKK